MAAGAGRQRPADETAFAAALLDDALRRELQQRKSSCNSGR